MADETQITDGSLIAAEKVNGTNVYNRAGEKLGHVEDIMIDKMSGRACYAIMSFGGFLGIGDKHWPLPWSALTYDRSKEGFVVNVDKKKLEKAPSYDSEDVAGRPTMVVRSTVTTARRAIGAEPAAQAGKRALRRRSARGQTGQSQPASTMRPSSDSARFSRLGSGV
ncbi:MAG TPA: PRC-barrel domain-containing protein [Reyranella sp.]|nr:PRC-barrel domain-containing protein [Reyranella sp.]